MRQRIHIESQLLNETALVCDAVVDPAVMHDVSIHLVIHLLQAPNVLPVAVLVHHVVRPIGRPHHLATILNDAPLYALDEVRRFACVDE